MKVFEMGEVTEMNLEWAIETSDMGAVFKILIEVESKATRGLGARS